MRAVLDSDEAKPSLRRSQNREAGGRIPKGPRARGENNYSGARGQLGPARNMPQRCHADGIA
eukprot:6806471-Pyramimonas_sp.AAC.1